MRTHYTRAAMQYQGSPHSIHLGVRSALIHKLRRLPALLRARSQCYWLIPTLLSSLDSSRGQG